MHYLYDVKDGGRCLVAACGVEWTRPYAEPFTVSQDKVTCKGCIEFLHIRRTTINDWASKL